mmetsp:Transcript_78731/g.227645  ORF Transcript_78731/g.227645 Transcript_78731/m.227645 type:complete len:254 (+) Transcript_78731:176-937(+)
MNEIPRFAPENNHVARLQTYRAVSAMRPGTDWRPVAEVRCIPQASHNNGPVLLRKVVVIGMPTHAASASVEVHRAHLWPEVCHRAGESLWKLLCRNLREILAELPEAFWEDTVDPVPKARLGAVVQRPPAVNLLPVPTSAYTLIAGFGRHRQCHIEQGLLKLKRQDAGVVHKARQKFLAGRQGAGGFERELADKCIASGLARRLMTLHRTISQSTGARNGNAACAYPSRHCDEAASPAQQMEHPPVHELTLNV